MTYAARDIRLSAVKVHLPGLILTYSEEYRKALDLTKIEHLTVMGYRVRSNGVHEVQVRQKREVDSGHWVSLEWLTVIDYGQFPNQHREWLRQRHIGECHPDHVEFKNHERRARGRPPKQVAA